MSPPEGPGGKGPNKPRGRALKQRVKTAKRRKTSSTRWLQRQLNDPYVAGAREEGYRSRAAYKLIQLDERFSLLRKGTRVVDLGSAPGGWSQIAAKIVGGAPVIAIDLQEVEPIAGVEMIVGDATDPDMQQAIRAALAGPADLVMSDMAAAATGHRTTDHMRTMSLAEEAYAIATRLLAPGGAFIAKVLRGGADDVLLKALKKDFVKVTHVKPEASRQDSREIYVVATGFRGEATA
ncbi:MAG: RlmE family RNA methyltransferase [Rhodospirillaceae bacterium]|nr:RlmE family RNA methyltransferase [Rhodospirillaceae bacterium]MBT6510754.1 RlmE family RNA methyltransferase [Rhodospirillaceae bacterium]MBT7613662.1 RlmE family RNA methyltransferase [Rhodospirillaceae bacterium]MBT7648322.1 RlmE family RNA methyltransferase [Rhodospirillaceae bacterium]